MTKKQLTEEDVARIVNFIGLYEGGKVGWNTIISVLPRLLDEARPRRSRASRRQCVATVQT